MMMRVLLASTSARKDPPPFSLQVQRARVASKQKLTARIARDNRDSGSAGVVRTLSRSPSPGTGVNYNDDSLYSQASHPSLSRRGGSSSPSTCPSPFHASHGLGRLHANTRTSCQLFPSATISTPTAAGAGAAAASGLVASAMACHKPKEYLLLQATQSVEKEVYAQHQREVMLAAKVVSTQHLLDEKMNRLEARRAAVEAGQRRVLLVKCLAAVLFIAKLQRQTQKMVDLTRSVARKAFLQRRSGIKIVNRFQLWHAIKRDTQRREFNAASERFIWKLILQMRISRKRKACKLLTYVLVDLKRRRDERKDKIQEIISKFLRQVRLVQRVIRSYLVCRQARVLMALAVWRRIEKQFVEVTN